MRIYRWTQTPLCREWLAVFILAGPSGCSDQDAYAVVSIDRSGLQTAATRLCVDATVGYVNATQQCYADNPDNVAFWLPFGTLHYDAQQGQWEGESITVTVDALNNSACLLATGTTSQRATYQKRLDLKVTLVAQGGCSP